MILSEKFYPRNRKVLQKNCGKILILSENTDVGNGKPLEKCRKIQTLSENPDVGNGKLLENCVIGPGCRNQELAFESVFQILLSYCT